MNPLFSFAGYLYVRPGRMRFYIDKRTKIEGVRASLTTPSQDGLVVLNVNVNGRSLFRPVFGAGQREMSESVEGYVGPGDYITVDIDKVGRPARNLVVELQVGRLGFFRWLWERESRVFR